MEDRPIVLVVEDNERVLLRAVNALRVRGYRAVGIDNAPDALRMTRLLNPSLVLLDDHLPGSSGALFAELVRDDPATGSIPIILLSSLRGPALEEQLWESGAVDALRKPFSAAGLLKRVEKWAAVPT
jgi:CheY-like chemotaxis protein